MSWRLRIHVGSAPSIPHDGTGRRSSVSLPSEPITVADLSSRPLSPASTHCIGCQAALRLQRSAPPPQPMLNADLAQMRYICYASPCYCETRSTSTRDSLLSAGDYKNFSSSPGSQLKAKPHRRNLNEIHRLDKKRRTTPAMLLPYGTPAG